jgi:NADH-quinone oxidoreductase subunit H
MFGPDDPSLIIQCTANNTCEAVHAVVSTLLIFFLLLTGFAYTTVLERRFIASIQSRIGPNRAGPKGLLQPVADGIKLIFKEDVIPESADKPVFYIAPLLKVIPALLVLAVVPLGPKVTIPWFDGKWYRVSQGLIDVNVGVLWLLAIMSVSVYGVTLAGWASNSKYSILGALRASAAMISYELSMGIIFAVPIMLAGSMSVGDIIDAQRGLLNWYVFQNPLAAIILFIALMAEINRAPFDMPEAEQELVAGHMTEYSGMKFAMFFMAEYINMIGISVIFCAMFLGGYDDGFGIVDGAPLLALLVLGGKVVFFLAFMVWIRGTIFRLRYDRLMTFGWKVLLPLAMVAVAWTAVSITIREEGGGNIAYLISTAGLFVVVLTIAYVLNRNAVVNTLPDLSESDIVPTNRGFGALALILVGILLAIPFALYETLVPKRSDKKQVEAKQ